ncbi:MAG: hypothetical protein GY795_44665 [Desulfobacterales bacterium]|nr:hypothetical protein [Desulfobacterales bacterium]
MKQYYYLLCFFCVLTVFGFTKNKPIDSSKRIRKTEILEPIPFILLSKPKIKKEWGHPHSPFGVFGEDLYKYKGYIDINGEKYRIHTYKQPFAVLKLYKRYYLLTQCYFNEEIFEWYESVERKFIKTEMKDLRKELCYLEFTDNDLSLFYKFWILNDLLNKDTMKFHDQFADYTGADARFIYEKKWLSSKKNTFQYFVSVLLQKAEDYPKQNELFDLFVTIINSSMQHDNPGDIRFICLLLLELNEERAKDVITEYVNKVHREDIPDDKRLLSMNPILGIIKVSEIAKKDVFKKFKKICEDSGYLYAAYHPNGYNTDDDPASGGMYYKRNIDEFSADFYIALMNNNDNDPYIEIKISTAHYHDTVYVNGKHESIKITIPPEDTQRYLDAEALPEFFFKNLYNLYKSK